MKETHNVDEYCINNRAERYNMTLYKKKNKPMAVQHNKSVVYSIISTFFTHTKGPILKPTSQR